MAEHVARIREERTGRKRVLTCQLSGTRMVSGQYKPQCSGFEFRQRTHNRPQRGPDEEEWLSRLWALEPGLASDRGSD